MSRQNNIRWNKNDDRRITNQVKRFNYHLDKRRDKLLKEGKVFEASSLPSRAYVSDLKSVGTRKELNKKMDEMQHFVETGNPYKINKNIEKSLNATIRDFNRMIDDMSKDNKKIIPYFTEKINKKEVIKEASNAEQLRENLKSYKRFYQDKSSREIIELPGTKNNVKTTKWLVDLYEERVSGINKRREEQKEKVLQTEVKYMGKSAGYKQMDVKQQEIEDEFRPLNLYTYSSTNVDLREKQKLIMRESNPDYYRARTELARQNYINKLEGLLGNTPQGKMLLEQIKKLPTDDFYRELKGDDDMFFRLYKLERASGDEVNAVVQEIWNEWFPDIDMDEKVDEWIEKQTRKVGA